MANIMVPGENLDDAVVFKPWQLITVDNNYPTSSNSSLMLVDGRIRYGSTVPPTGRLIAYVPPGGSTPAQDDVRDTWLLGEMA
jgi:hypothetical protein